MEDKKILVLDFDGVLHSYTSGWEGASTISDLPVPGAIKFLWDAAELFDVAILSARSHQWGGRRAMKRWLLQSFEVELHGTTFKDKPSWVQSITGDEEVWVGHRSVNSLHRAVARRMMKLYRFPRHKPPAHVTIDDRALTFTGEWPTTESLLSFKPWNKRGPITLESL